MDLIKVLYVLTDYIIIDVLIVLQTESCLVAVTKSIVNRPVRSVNLPPPSSYEGKYWGVVRCFRGVFRRTFRSLSANIVNLLVITMHAFATISYIYKYTSISTLLFLVVLTLKGLFIIK